jgi:hypothetical protein
VKVGALLAGLMLTWSGCGEEGVTRQNAPRGDSLRLEARQAAAPQASRCGSQLGGLLDVLDALRNQLAVGLSYEGYAGLVRDARSVHAEVPAERLALACVTLVGTPAERALNAYISGVNEWGACLADAACATDEVEPRLQRRWESASDLLLTAQRGLRQLPAPEGSDSLRR